MLFDIRSIYRNFLEISNTNEDPHRKGSFLDIDIKISNNKFVTTVYDKRRDYNFETLGLPTILSNVPSNMTFGIICSQFCRFANICMMGCDFVFNCQLVINKIKENGFPSELLRKYVRKFKYKKGLTIAKFNFDRDLDQLLEF